MDVKYDLDSHVRVSKLANTPSQQEFPRISKIVGAGTLLVGLPGSIILAVMSFLPGRV